MLQVASDMNKLVSATIFASLLFWAGRALLDLQVIQSAPMGDLFILLGIEEAVAGGLCLALAIAAMAGAQFVFMTSVADEVCPDAPMVGTGLLKFAAAVACWGAILAAVLGKWVLFQN